MADTPRQTSQINQDITTQPTPANKITSTLLTTADILTKIITGSDSASSRSYQLPTAANMEADLGLSVGQAREFSVINLSPGAADTITLTVNTGVGIVGSPVIAAGADTVIKSGLFRLRKTAANTFICYRIA